jgi:GDP/UDP-N,N'-diacetylbacillosamine 2-epimerase (hydrolysing)
LNIKKRKVCFVTGSRAEYGIISVLMKKIRKVDSLELQIIATGMHLSHEFGNSFQQIEEDGFVIDKKIDILLSSGSSVGISKSIGLGIISFSDVFSNLVPDIVVLTGDRFEMFSAACAATVAKIPIAHIHGGETTEGAFDEAFRHSISKMSHIHFTSTDEYRSRVIQLGENPNRVFNVGSLGVENLKSLKLLSKSDFEKSIDFKLGKYNLLITFHPETLEESSVENQFKSVLSSLDKLKDFKFIFTKSNADVGGYTINKMIDDYVNSNPNKSIAFKSLGQLRYFSALKHVDGIIGNSSSSLIEAPSLYLGAINVGDRQKGRVQSDSVINCSTNVENIDHAIKSLFKEEFKQKLNTVINPYDKDKTSDNIIRVITNYPLKNILKKAFYNI